MDEHDDRDLTVSRKSLEKANVGIGMRGPLAGGRDVGERAETVTVKKDRTVRSWMRSQEHSR